ncbi:MAG: 16S rRNA (guanine(527)-N(7))-methyltransferase RsmG [Proteobacteria bacterium]|nr:16S rRNA (guanine(527)-N(7))-methyltransferase RsmG [Pseudomonadota bacterium]
MSKDVSRETAPWADRPEPEILIDGAARIGVSLTGEQARALMTLMAEIRRWNRKINLIGPAPPAEQIVIHLIDSLSPLPILPCASMDVMDLGSGAGLPGMVLALVRPEWRMTLVEMRGKKADFLRHVRRTIGPEGLRVMETRLENESPGPEDKGFDLVTARAFGGLTGIMALAAPRLRQGGRILAYKGPLGPGELEASHPVLTELGLEVERIETVRLPFVGHERRLVFIRRSA